MNVVLCGGGTGGPVTALLAIADEMRRRDPSCSFQFIGTQSGPERLLVEAAQIPFMSISAGKLRRYLDWRNVTDIFRIIVGFTQSFRLLKSLRPDLVISTGSFVAVPLVWAASVLKIPAMTHQLDIDPGLANRLMLPFVRLCTVGFSETVVELRSAKAVQTGNPFRASVTEGNTARARRLFDLRDDLPVVLCTGGGTGAARLNHLFLGAAMKLFDRCQVIHITGKGKRLLTLNHPNYHSYEFLLEEMRDALAVADVVVSRAGLATLTELSVLRKPTILVPISGSHQERNAQFYGQRDAALVLEEPTLTDSLFAQHISRLLDDSGERQRLSDRMGSLAAPDANRRVVDEILKLIPV